MMTQEIVTCGNPGESLETRQAIGSLEQRMREHPETVIPGAKVLDLPVRHLFSKGLYARELTLPAGTLAVGKLHRFEHLNVISKGKIAVVSENGRAVITAPHIWNSLPGAKHVGFAMEETVWTTFHPSEETDPEKLEAALAAPDYDDPVLCEEMGRLALALAEEVAK